MASAKPASDFREQLAADMDYNKVRRMLQRAMNGKMTKPAYCSSCKKTLRVEVTDYATAIKAADFWASHAFGKAAIARAVEPTDLVEKDPLKLELAERVALRERVEALLADRSA